jgi:transcriptional regulator with XRE-family HTH domain
LGYTQNDLAKSMRVASNTIARIERGEQAVRWSVLERLVDNLHQPAAYFFSTVPPPVPLPLPPTVEALTKVIEQQEVRIRELESKIHALTGKKPAALPHPGIPDDILERLKSADPDEIARIRRILATDEELDSFEVDDSAEEEEESG